MESSFEDLRSKTFQNGKRDSNESFKETWPIVHLGKYTATKTDEFSENFEAKMPVYVESTKMLPNAEIQC